MERYRERLAGVLSCYDRIIVTGTLPGACYADGMTAFLSARQVRTVRNFVRRLGMIGRKEPNDAATQRPSHP